MDDNDNFLPTISEPSTRYWRIANFSKLEFIESTSFEFYLPSALNVVPKFDFMLIPIGYHSHIMDSVSIIIEHEKQFKDSAKSQNIPEKYRNAEVAFKLSFVNSSGQKCNTQEAKIPLFTKPDLLFDQDVELNIAYDYLADPTNDLLSGDKLTILIEGKILGEEDLFDENNNEDQELQDSEEFESNFDFDQFKFDVQQSWVIDRVSSLKGVIKSPDIQPPTWDKMSFNLELYPYGFSVAQPNATFVSLCCSFHSRLELNVRYRVSIVNSSGTKCLTQEGQSKYNFLGEVNNTYFKFFRNYLFDPANSLIQNDKLTLHCEIKILSKVKTGKKRPLWPLFSSM